MGPCPDSSFYGNEEYCLSWKGHTIYPKPSLLRRRWEGPWHPHGGAAVLHIERTVDDSTGCDLAVSGVCKRFGPVTALDEVSLTVASGEFVTILGPSGCGKTTLLRDRRGAGARRPRARSSWAAADITRPARQPPPRQHRLPELRPVSPPQRLREHRLRPAGPEVPRRQRWTAASARPWRCCTSRSCRGGAPRSSPAGRSSAWPSPARW